MAGITSFNSALKYGPPRDVFLKTARPRPTCSGSATELRTVPGNATSRTATTKIDVNFIFNL